MSTGRPTPPEQEPDKATNQGRQSLSQHNYYSTIDRIVAAGQAEGAFDNLPGAGKPLRLDDDSMVPEEDRVGYRMLRNAGFGPPWIELQKTIREKQAELQTWLAGTNGRWARMSEWEQKRASIAYREKIVELQRLILHFNLKVPAAVGQIDTPKLEDELARLGV